MTVEPTVTQSGNTEVTTPPAAGTFTQDQVNAMLADERRKEQAKQKEATDKARRETEEANKAKQGEFQSLAEQRAARITELEAAEGSKTERLTALEVEIKAQTDARLKLLPQEIRDMKPETDDPLVVYRWLTRAEQAASKLTGQKPANPGTPPGPRNGSGAPSSAAGDVLAQKRSSGIY